jgi:hypothetical protein
MLLVWLTLPIANNDGPEVFLDSAADFNLGMVADKQGAPWCRMTSCKVLTNTFLVLREYTSQTVDVKPTKS